LTGLYPLKQQPPQEGTGQVPGKIKPGEGGAQNGMPNERGAHGFQKSGMPVLKELHQRSQ